MAQNSDTKPARRRGKGRPFSKGQSGNPGGVPKAAIDLRRALERDGDEIHAALMALVREGNPQAVIYAHQRAFGKPPQPVELSGPDGGALEVVVRLERA